MKIIEFLFLSISVLLLQTTTYGQSWSLTGNSGTNPSVNFIGTKDAKPLVFKVNNQKGGYLDISNTVTSFGYQGFSKFYRQLQQRFYAVSKKGCGAAFL